MNAHTVKPVTDQWYWTAYGYALAIHDRTEGKSPRPHAFAEFYAGYGSDYATIKEAWWRFVLWSD